MSEVSRARGIIGSQNGCLSSCLFMFLRCFRKNKEKTYDVVGEHNINGEIGKGRGELLLSDIEVRREQEGLILLSYTNTSELPKFMVSPYMRREDLDSISYYGSSAGHGYPLHIEGRENHSYKHYFRFKHYTDNAPVIYAPCNGIIESIEREGVRGCKISIKVEDLPYLVTIFHVRPEISITKGTKITAGERLGVHYTNETWSDISVFVLVNNNGCSMPPIVSSVFSHMTAGLLKYYGVREASDMFANGKPSDWYCLSSRSASTPKLEL